MESNNLETISNATFLGEEMCTNRKHNFGLVNNLAFWKYQSSRS